MNLTAEQIKQALQCLAKCGECKESSCEYYMESNDVCMCDNISIAKDTLDYINHFEAENGRLQAEREKAIKDFTEFAQTAFENPFACKYCKYSVREGRGCLWKAEHEESCMGRYFEYKESGG